MSEKENDLREVNRERLKYIEKSEEIYKIIMSHPQLQGAKIEDVIDVLQAAISRDSLKEIEGDFLCDIDRLESKLKLMKYRR